MLPISAVIIVRNEEDRLKNAIASARGVCAEVIVVDDHSSDRTADVARQAGAQVLTRALAGDFAAQRNAGAAMASYDWVLVIDADEVLPETTQQEIRRVFSAGDLDAEACSLRIINVLFDKPLYYSSGDCRTVRLYRRSCCSFGGEVHEKLDVPGKILELQGEVWNYPVKTIDHLIMKVLQYTEVEAVHFCAASSGVSEKVFRYELTWKSLKRFWKHYVKHQGYKDGTAGLVWCLCNVIGPQIRCMKILEQARRLGKLVK